MTVPRRRDLRLLVKAEEAEPRLPPFANRLPVLSYPASGTLKRARKKPRKGAIAHDPFWDVVPA